MLKRAGLLLGTAIGVALLITSCFSLSQSSREAEFSSNWATIPPTVETTDEVVSTLTFLSVLPAGWDISVYPYVDQYLAFEPLYAMDYPTAAKLDEMKSQYERSFRTRLAQIAANNDRLRVVTSADAATHVLEASYIQRHVQWYSYGTGMSRVLDTRTTLLLVDRASSELVHSSTLTEIHQGYRSEWKLLESYWR